MAGLKGTNILLSSSIQYVINVIMTIPALIWIDRWGRRPMFLVGAALMMTWLFVNAGTFYPIACMALANILRGHGNIRSPSTRRRSQRHRCRILDPHWQASESYHCNELLIRRLFCSDLGTSILGLPTRAVPSSCQRQGGRAMYIRKLGFQLCARVLRASCISEYPVEGTLPLPHSQ
jgi:MFS family permease